MYASMKAKQTKNRIQISFWAWEVVQVKRSANLLMIHILTSCQQDTLVDQFSAVLPRKTLYASRADLNLSHSLTWVGLGDHSVDPL